MKRRIAATAALALFACPPAALAADQTVQAVDGAASDGSDNRWTPNVVDIAVGETVRWNFGGTAIPHNVKGVNFVVPENRGGVAGPPVAYKFTAVGTYEFFCELHAQPMRGTVRVGNPPPPPPPPLSEQPFANDLPAPAALELLDEQPPALTKVRVTRVTRGARVRFRLSEAARVTIKLTRGNRVVKTRIVNARRGANSLVVRGVREGRYRVQLSARDLSGNPARSQRTRVTVRS